MNIYFGGMVIAMILFVAISSFVSKKVKTAEDFYVAGRRAPVILIAGSLIASYSSTGMFMGDAATCYQGAFAPIVLFAGMQSAGYIFGAVFFGRYLRRSRALTMPEFFGQRFHSPQLRFLAAITASITMSVYLLSVIQGIGTLMEIVTGINYRVCIVIAMLAFTYISVVSGSRGVLITDTLMATIFTLAIIFGVGFIAHSTGGWYDTLKTIASNADTAKILSWAGEGGVLGEAYKGGVDNVLWGLIYGIVWMSVCMIGPWQASRYQMAKSEHVIVKSSFYAALGVFALEFLSGIAAVMVVRVNKDLVASHVLIWASMNLMPRILGVILLTGILAAGISSATTFQSLVGASFSNDIIPFWLKKRGKENSCGDRDKYAINIGRVAMVVVAIIVTVIALINPPAIFVVMYLGGAMMASSWMPVAVGSVFSKRLTKTGAFCGMLAGFAGTFLLKILSFLLKLDLPVYLDPSFVGIMLNILGMVIGSACTQVTKEEKDEREKMFIIPEEEKDVKEVRKTISFAKKGIGIGLIAFLGMFFLWILPYYMG